jgi:hypothetical protein
LNSDETGRASFEEVFGAGKKGPGETGKEELRCDILRKLYRPVVVLRAIVRRHFHEVSNPCAALRRKHEEAGVRGSMAATAHGKRVGEIVGDQIARQILRSL